MTYDDQGVGICVAPEEKWKEAGFLVSNMWKKSAILAPSKKDKAAFEAGEEQFMKTGVLGTTKDFKTQVIDVFNLSKLVETLVLSGRDIEAARTAMSSLATITKKVPIDISLGPVKVDFEAFMKGLTTILSTEMAEKGSGGASQISELSLKDSDPNSAQLYRRLFFDTSESLKNHTKPELGIVRRGTDRKWMMKIQVYPEHKEEMKKRFDKKRGEERIAALAQVAQDAQIEALEYAEKERLHELYINAIIYLKVYTLGMPADRFAIVAEALNSRLSEACSVVKRETVRARQILELAQ